ncbi:hypothetical protein [Caulobacter sp. 17J80-11]|uniref:hypothetical protein n=1 Tax=Caulobacter sp. 17J80-11 TaxID=2763502 RepID=UPI0016539A90|nr:hypothetical protein [Caulobacter sp. 17J80-11]MBC6981348.1 hypothetical protein [Caulobacter sp. 17J80-11]
MSRPARPDERARVHPARAAWEFLDPVLVDCPACGACASVRVTEPPAEDRYRRLTFGARRMTCSRCSAVREQPATEVSNPTLGLPLRLVAPTRHGELVFFNLEHLDYVRAYLADRVRAESFTESGPRNTSVFSRLPAWAKRAQARDEVLAAIDKARAKAA